MRCILLHTVDYYFQVYYYLYFIYKVFDFDYVNDYFAIISSLLWLPSRFLMHTHTILLRRLYRMLDRQMAFLGSCMPQFTVTRLHVPTILKFHVTSYLPRHSFSNKKLL